MSRVLDELFRHAAKRRITQAAIAKALATYPDQIRNYVNGSVTPSISRVEEIAQAVGCRLIVLPDDGVELVEALGYEVIIRRKNDV